MKRAVTLVVLILLAQSGTAGADELSIPEGKSTQKISGLDVWFDVPAGLTAEKPGSLVVILHGFGGTASGMAGALGSWSEKGFVVCAPKARGQGWEAQDLVDVLKIASMVKTSLAIDPDKVHVVGFSNGGWNLASLAFDGDLEPVSATWVAAGYRGGNVPKWARERLAVVALAGAQDGNLKAARGTVKALHDKVRSVEFRVQPGLGHKWPDQHMTYLRWWMGVMEGRYVPGDDMSFEWRDSLEDALEIARPEKKGGVFIYVYDPEVDATNPDAKALQNEVFHDLSVRHYGRQLQGVRMPWPAAKVALEARKIKLKSTPAIVLLKKDGKLKKVLQGRIKAKKLASAFKSLAADKSDPLN